MQCCHNNVKLQSALLVQSEDYQKQSQNMAIVRQELKANNKVGIDTYQSLTIIDAVQRLGIDHHFKDEIEQVLERLYMAISPGFFKNKDLCLASLCFRLLRQQHYHVHAGVCVCVCVCFPEF